MRHWTLLVSAVKNIMMQVSMKYARHAMVAGRTAIIERR